MIRKDWAQNLSVPIPNLVVFGKLLKLSEPQKWVEYLHHTIVMKPQGTDVCRALTTAQLQVFDKYSFPPSFSEP